MYENMFTAEEYETLHDTAEKHVPEEILDYVWGTPFSKTVGAIGTEFKLSTEQTNIVEDAIRDSILGILDDEQELFTIFSHAGIPEDIHKEILSFAYSYCIVPALETLDFRDMLNDIESETSLILPIVEKKKPTSETVTPIITPNAFSVIQKKLEQTETLLPTSKKYGLEPLKKSADPYRENI